jgi:hypothetical protein
VKDHNRCCAREAKFNSRPHHIVFVVGSATVGEVFGKYSHLGVMHILPMISMPYAGLKLNG